MTTIQRVSILGALGLALAATLAAAEEPPREPASLGGTWEGKVTFTNGWEARAQLELEVGKEPGAWVGTYALTQLGEDGPEAPRKGTVTGSLQGDRVTLRLEGGVYTAQIADAAPHAERAVFGTFRAGRRRGVFVLWRYRR
jgi:hypothetical protein